VDDKRYYDFLNHGIEWKDKPNINGHGFITWDGIPFYDAGDAVKYIMNHYPETEPKDKPIKEDPKACREGASKLLKEIERLVETVETFQKETRNELYHKAEQRDSIPGKSIFEEVEKKRLHEEVEKKIGESLGLSIAWRLLHDRKYELWNCTRLGGASG
jgi:hypothetical protein